MNRNKKGKNRKLFKKKSHSNNRLGCIIAIIVLIPILFGVYLYCQQINIQKNNEPQTDTSFQIPPGKDLETPVSLVPRQEQIIRHSGYTVSYNKDLKIPNWVSYELTREETKGKEKRGNRFIADPLVTGPIATMPTMDAPTCRVIQTLSSMVMLSSTNWSNVNFMVSRITLLRRMVCAPFLPFLGMVPSYAGLVLDMQH